MFGFLRLPISNEDEIRPGRYDFEVNSTFENILDLAVDVGSTFNVSSYRAVVTAKRYDKNGSLTVIQADIEPAVGALEAKVTFQQFFVAIASLLAIVGAAFLFDRIYRVIDNPVIELAVVGAVVVAVGYSLKKFLAKK